MEKWAQNKSQEETQIQTPNNLHSKVKRKVTAEEPKSVNGSPKTRSNYCENPEEIEVPKQKEQHPKDDRLEELDSKGHNVLLPAFCLKALELIVELVFVTLDTMKSYFTIILSS